MKRILYIIPVLLFLTLFASAIQAGTTMTGEQISALLTGKTTDCAKTSDGSTCATFFSSDGVVKRILDESGKRRDGKWYVDEENHLCILWDGKPEDKTLRFELIDNGNGSYDLFKGGDLKSTITKIQEGNTRDL